MTVRFHPVVDRWFAGRFREPTGPQQRAWPLIQAGRDVLIAAPTGSGKTFAAFLAAIDDLLRQGLNGALTDDIQVVYVSPLKALSNDIQKNLSQPLEEIRSALLAAGLPDADLRVLLRTGDTAPADRQAMVRRPPHILVTTPESLYLILTSERAREVLRNVRTVIVDEIHAVARDKRGSHLTLSLERLAALSRHPVQRIGLSATQKPLAEIARFLVGSERPLPAIVDTGHARELDLGIEIPPSPLEAVMSAEVWEEVDERLAQLIAGHKTTLVFVNTRRLCERLTMQLSERLGADQVTSHHGSLSREKRLEAETRLKNGGLKALVATASLELGIDIGTVDLVCQIGTPRSIATLLQRVGRSGHRLGAVPKGRIFPLSRDELIECAAAVRAAREGQLDRLIIPERPLDILAQQLVAAVACEEWDETALYDLVHRAYPYRDLTRSDYDAVVRMLSEGFTTKRGRRAAYIHYDGVNGRLRARRGARLAALTSGGAIPDLGDYRVVLEPTETFIGTLNEDFAVESTPGDIFQLGNASYLILKVESGQVRVADAQGQPPSLPFWLGEAPARTDELSAEVSRLRCDIDQRLPDVPGAIRWLEEIGVPEPAARQMAEYLAATRAVLGVVPSQKTLVLERFFDEAGGMQLVLHAPFGARINKAWGLALRKRFCRSFNFELQAAANDEAIVISLGPHHSFPLESVFQYLNPATVRDILIQAMLVAPMFQSRWRWNATRALAVLRFRAGRQVPTPLQRMEAEDLSAAVFPDQLACPENLAGDREIPDHPLIRQTIDDCLTEAMDLAGLVQVLDGIAAGRFTLVARDTTEPSPIAHEILNAKPYAFLDDAPLEERRTQAVTTRRSLDVKTAEEFGKLDADAIARVQEEAWPEVSSADELHDTLLVTGAIPERDWGSGNGERSWAEHFDALARERRAGVLEGPGRFWAAAERLPMLAAAYPGAACTPALTVPERERARAWTREAAIRELVRGRLEVLGPTTASAIAADLGLPRADVEFGLGGLEQEGFVLRGRFTSGVTELEWCERRLLARIHRYTLDRLRREIEPVSSADFMRFLFRWQRLTDDTRAEGPDGLAAVLDILDGFELPAGAWESDVLPARVTDYDPLWLDGLCLSGAVAWGRLSPPPAAAGTGGHKSGPIRTTPLALFRRERGEVWRAIAPEPDATALPLSHGARAAFDLLKSRGASFFGDLVNATGLLRTEVEKALGELVAWGLVVSDSFAGLRALLVPSDRRKPIGRLRRRGRSAPFGVETAGRWSRTGRRSLLTAEQQAEAVAWMLLRRYGVVFRRLLERETVLVPWRDVLRVYRRLEARGEIRGGRFVGGFSGEQYALPEAVGTLRAVRRAAATGALVAVSGADPLNLVGVIVPGDPVPALAGNRILYRDGVAVAVRGGNDTRFLGEAGAEERNLLQAALVRQRVAPLVRAYLGKH